MFTKDALGYIYFDDNTKNEENGTYYKIKLDGFGEMIEFFQSSIDLGHDGDWGFQYNAVYPDNHYNREDIGKYTMFYNNIKNAYETKLNKEKLIEARINKGTRAVISGSGNVPVYMSYEMKQILIDNGFKISPYIVSLVKKDLIEKGLI